MPLFFKRGAVYLVEFVPPDEPSKPIQKFALCLQEGKIVDFANSFVAVILTTIKENKEVKDYPWQVILSPEESQTEHGAIIICNQIHTIPKENIRGHKYTLSDATMEEVNEKLMLGIGVAKIEDLEPD
jgi:mRNA-degrading endonuclease toxin of MazEF toxin-antitoxin module